LTFSLQFSIQDFGPFRLGKWSWPINFASFLVRNFLVFMHFRSLSVQFTIFVCILFILPTAYPVDVLNMNYAIVAVGGLLVVITINWFWWGRHSFKGLVKTVMS
jgi:hypothetical protein